MTAIAYLIAFLLGSIPFGLLVARAFHGGNLREQGSGNIGATNVTRVLGFWPAGFLTFVLDFAKGALPVALVAWGPLGTWLSSHGEALHGAEAWWAGFFAVAGHCFTPWLRFQGGKGVATAFGAVLLLSSWAALAGAIVYALTFFITRVSSKSSLLALLAIATTHWVLYPVEGTGTQFAALGAILYLILLRHESNLDALLENRERTFR